MQLVPHSRSAAVGAPLRLAASAERRADRLAIEFVIEGPLGRVRWPAPVPPQRTDGLWQHTCLEAFLAEPRRPAYCELNFSPSTAWAAYRFSGYREGREALALDAPPETTTEIGPGRARVQASLGLGAILRALGNGTDALELALSAVVEDDSGELSYWALRHAAEQPDFHRRESFVLSLAR